MLTEKTFIMLKPDAVNRCLIGEVITRIEKKGYQITQAKLMMLDKKVIAEHYDHLLDKSFYPDLETFIMLKPDAVNRCLIGEVITRIEKKCYQITQAKLMMLDKKVIAEHYDHLLDKSFYPDLENFMTSGPVFGMVVEGENVIAGMRQ